MTHVIMPLFVTMSINSTFHLRFENFPKTPLAFSINMLLSFLCIPKVKTIVMVDVMEISVNITKDKKLSLKKRDRGNTIRALGIPTFKTGIITFLMNRFIGKSIFSPRIFVMVNK